MGKTGVGRPRWRCGEPGCPAHRKPHPVDTPGEYDPVDVALEALEQHYRTTHPDREATVDA